MGYIGVITRLLTSWDILVAGLPHLSEPENRRDSKNGIRAYGCFQK